MTTASASWDIFKHWLGPKNLVSVVPASSGPPNPPLIWTDTRAPIAGEWYLPIKGARFDGHDFVGDAIRAGAVGCIVAEDRLPGLQPGATPHVGWITVKDTLSAFQAIASGWRRLHGNVKVCCLTGSSGKTTTREILARVLEEGGPTLSNEASFNNEVGVPKTLLRLREDHRFAAVELGARHRGDIQLLTEMCLPDCAAVLNVGGAHLAEFGSRAAILEAKSEIYRDSGSNCILVAPADDASVVAAARHTGKHVLLFGQAEQADVRIVRTGVDYGRLITAIEFRIGGSPFATEISTVHDRLGVNAAAATALGLGVGVTAGQAMAGLAKFRGVPGRFFVHRFPGLSLVDDAYNANPDSVLSGLRTLKGAAAQSKGTVVVLGDMLELGEEDQGGHESVGRFVAENLPVCRLITVGAKSEEWTAGAARRAGMASSQIASFPDVEALLAKIVPLEERTDIVYVKGSNAIGLSRVVAALKQVFESRK